VSYKTYFADNPKVADELKDLQKPVNDLVTQCGIQPTSSSLTDALKSI
jgi:hypothetical protein